MLNLSFLKNIITIILLVLLQVFIFGNITFNGIISPYIYVIFILLYQPFRNRYVFLLLCFLLGWGVDIFENTGGINAFASVTIGFLSKYIIRMVSGIKFFEVDEFRFSDFSPGQWFYTVIMVLIHHLILFFLETFSFENALSTLLKALYSSAFTIIFICFYLILFRRKTER